MTVPDPPSMSTAVEVAVDPATAFVIFTEEIDQWWGNGPIDAWSYARCQGRSIEPGIGGRFVEHQVDGDLELGVVTVWEPGRQVSWSSSVDDMVIDVTFEALAPDRTRVQVQGVATGPDVGAGLAVVRVTPQWLPRHLERRAAGRRLARLGPLHLTLHTPAPAATARWLAEAFGFDPTRDLPDQEPEGDQYWIELRLGDGSAALFLRYPDEGDGDPQRSAVLPWVFVPDLDALITRATAAGAEIVAPITDHGYRSVILADHERRRWQFVQDRPVR